MTFCSCCKHCHFSKLLALHTIVCNNKILKNVHMLPSKKKICEIALDEKKSKVHVTPFFWQNISICCFCPKFYMLSSELPTILVVSFANVLQKFNKCTYFKKCLISNKEQTKVDITTSRLGTLAGFAKACYTTLRMGG